MFNIKCSLSRIRTKLLDNVIINKMNFLILFKQVVDYVTYKLSYADNHLRFLKDFLSFELFLTTPIPAVVIFAETAFPASKNYRMLNYKSTN